MSHSLFVSKPFPAVGLFGGGEGIRTPDPLLAGQVLSQLSYTPKMPLRGFPDRISVRLCSLSGSLIGFHRSDCPKFGQRKLNNNRSDSSFCRDIAFFLRTPGHSFGTSHILLRKEVIQPHLPIRLPCYDLTPIIEPTFGSSLLAVRTLTSGLPDFHGLTGGVYKARERIHRDILIRDY